MNFYIASKLENAKRVRQLADTLKSWGWQHTYDWTSHGLVLGKDKLQGAAAEELAGVIRAQIVIVLLPGGRGTHTEIGLALAYGKRIVLHSEDSKPFDHEKRETCSFYWLPEVERVQCPWEELPRWLKEKYSFALQI